MIVSVGASEKPRPRSPTGVRIVTWTAFLALYIPLIVVVIYSFLVRDTVTQTSSFGFEYYRRISENEVLMDSLRLSLWVAALTTLGATFLGTMAALAMEKWNFPGKKIFDTLSLLPLVMPELVMGLSLLIWFSVLHITLGSFSMILAHITFTLSYVIMTVRTRFRDFDISLDEAARDLGANSWQVFWKVTFPLILPGILSGALMAFTLSFDDFLVSFFTAGVSSDTLPLKLYSMTKLGFSGEVNALSAIVLAGTMLLVFLIQKPGRIVGRNTSK